MVIRDGTKSSSFETMIFSNNIQKGPVKGVTRKSKIVYIMVLLDVKYNVAMESQSCQ